MTISLFSSPLLKIEFRLLDENIVALLHKFNLKSQYVFLKNSQPHWVHEQNRKVILQNTDLGQLNRMISNGKLDPFNGQFRREPESHPSQAPDRPYHNPQFRMPRPPSQQLDSSRPILRYRLDNPTFGQYTHQ